MSLFAPVGIVLVFAAIGLGFTVALLPLGVGLEFFFNAMIYGG